MNVYKLARSVAARSMFAIHSLITIWRTAVTYNDGNFWLFIIVIIMMGVEGVMNFIHLDGNETQLFCPCIFLFLMGTVPPLWFLELYISAQSAAEASGATSVSHLATASITQDGRLSHLTSIHFTDAANLSAGINGVKKPVDPGSSSAEDTIVLFEGVQLSGSPEQWAQFLEQTLLVVLILGRWILPKGQMSREQLSHMLLVYLATAADIVELFESFKEPEIRRDRNLNIIILGIWSFSLIQYPIVMPSPGRRSARPGGDPDEPVRRKDGVVDPEFGLSTKKRESAGNISLTPMQRRKRTFFATCHTVLTDVTVWGIVEVSVLQDAPFLAIRLYLIFGHSISSYTMIFFTCKNTLVCVLQFYRLVIICGVAAKKARTEDDLAIAFAKSHDLIKSPTKRAKPKKLNIKRLRKQGLSKEIVDIWANPAAALSAVAGKSALKETAPVVKITTNSPDLKYNIFAISDPGPSNWRHHFPLDLGSEYDDDICKSTSGEGRLSSVDVNECSLAALSVEELVATDLKSKRVTTFDRILNKCRPKLWCGRQLVPTVTKRVTTNETINPVEPAAVADLVKMGTNHEPSLQQGSNSLFDSRKNSPTHSSIEIAIESNMDLDVSAEKEALNIATPKTIEPDLNNQSHSVTESSPQSELHGVADLFSSLEKIPDNDQSKSNEHESSEDAGITTGVGPGFIIRRFLTRLKNFFFVQNMFSTQVFEKGFRKIWPRRSHTSNFPTEPTSWTFVDNQIQEDNTNSEFSGQKVDTLDVRNNQSRNDMTTEVVIKHSDHEREDNTTTAQLKDTADNLDFNHPEKLNLNQNETANNDKIILNAGASLQENGHFCHVIQRQDGCWVSDDNNYETQHDDTELPEKSIHRSQRIEDQQPNSSAKSGGFVDAGLKETVTTKNPSRGNGAAATSDANTNSINEDIDRSKTVKATGYNNIDGNENQEDTQQVKTSDEKNITRGEGDIPGVQSQSADITDSGQFEMNEGVTATETQNSLEPFVNEANTQRNSTYDNVI